MIEKALLTGTLLFLFGIVFNRAVSYLESRKMLEGFTWMAVVAGVGVTIIIVALLWWNVEMIGWQWAALMTVAFASSGLPMAAGSVWRYVTSRRADQLDMAGR